MTMRQWYKGMALQGLLARGAFSKETIHLTAQYAGAIADAMLAEDAEREGEDDRK
jgi:hypothetical protein